MSSYSRISVGVSFDYILSKKNRLIADGRVYKVAEFRLETTSGLAGKKIQTFLLRVVLTGNVYFLLTDFWSFCSPQVPQQSLKRAWRSAPKWQRYMDLTEFPNRQKIPSAVMVNFRTVAKNRIIEISSCNRRREKRLQLYDTARWQN